MKIFMFLLFFSISCYANPFMIDFPEKQNLTNDDFIEIQAKLRQIDVDQIVDQYWPTNPILDKADFYTRLRVGLRSVLIDPERGCYPKTILRKIGRGGSNCVVTYATFNGTYPQLAESIPEALEKVGFNGYFYCRIGGYPTPTGRETKYIGVPYAFKIFMLQEAFLQGFESVLWIDSALLPLKNPQPLFDHIKRYGAFFYSGGSFSFLDSHLFPIVHESLYELYQGTTADAYIIWTAFGFHKTFPETWRFFDEYFRAVKMGYPFISHLPEMPVIAVIASKMNYNPIVFSINSSRFKKVSPPNKERNEKYYFWWREHGRE